MSISDLGSVRQYLLGNHDDTGDSGDRGDWLQQCLVSMSPGAGVITLATGDRMVICHAKYTAGTKHYTPVFKVCDINTTHTFMLIIQRIYPLITAISQGSVTVTESEEVTSVVTLTMPGPRSQVDTWSHVIVCGYSTGHVRIFTDTGVLVMQKLFQVRST